MTKPMPCPFCGSSDIVVIHYEFVRCRNCYATLHSPLCIHGGNESKEDLINRWNTRYKEES